MGAGIVAPRLTLVTLDCRPFDIMKSVAEAVVGVYSPAVLRLRDQPLWDDQARTPTGHDTRRVPRTRMAVKPRSPRAAIQSVAVQLTEAECDDFDGWLRRATAAGGTREPLIKFATWYPAVAQRWFDAATASGVWDGGREPGRSARDYCRHSSESLSHAERSDGVMVHLVVDTASRPYAFRARWCRDAFPIPFTQRWTDDQQLTWEEFTSGEPCRACGRGFVGAPEWKPILVRTPEEAAAIEREEADFRALHPNCPTFSWRYGSTGVTHCAECCPRPPLSPHQVEVITRIVVDVVQRQHQDALDLERRWRATSTEPIP